MMKNQFSPTQGFSLLEVLIAAVIVMISASWAIPQYRRQLALNQLDQYTQKIESGLFSLRARQSAEGTSCEMNFSANHVGTDNITDGFGTVENLVEFGKIYDFEVITIPAQDVSLITVSSTKIRKAIEKSEFEKVNQFLGRPFEVNGTIIKGDGLGRTIGFPTANLEVDEEYKLIPKKGVYLVKVFYKKSKYLGMMNIGNRPTINGDNQTQEVHLFDYNQSIYGDTIKVCFLKKIRNEKKFDSLEELKKQLLKDQEICKRIISSL